MCAQSVNVLNSLFLTDGEHCILTPNYDVFDMYQVHQGAYTLGFEEKNKDPEVCIFASIKNDDIYVNLVNTSYSESKKIELKFKQCPEFVEAKTLYSKIRRTTTMRNIRTESAAKKEKHLHGKKTPSRLHCRRLRSAFIISEKQKQKSNTYKTGRPGEKDCSHRAAHFYYKNNSITNTTAQHATET